MLQFHYHFAETSLVDILQLVIGTLGFAGLLVTLWQTQKNITLQIQSVRNSQRPLFTIESRTEQQLSVNNSIIMNVVLTVHNHAANDLRIESIDPKKLMLGPIPKVDKYFCPRLEAGKSYVFGCAIYPDQASSPIRPGNLSWDELIKSIPVRIKIMYMDEGGFGYEQKILFLDNDFILQSPKFL